MGPLSTCLWFNGNAEEAARYYESFITDCKITSIAKRPPATAEVSGHPEGEVMMVQLSMLGHEFTFLNGGPEFQFTGAISFIIPCKDQAEVDHYWDHFSDEGKPIKCGWIQDRFGVVWQVVPSVIPEIFGSKDPDKINKMSAAMMKMGKLDVAALRAAAES